MAAWQNRPDVVELLLLNGASVRLRMISKCVWLHFSLFVKVDLPNAMGSTPLHFACQYCQAGKPFSIIKLLQV